MLFMFGYCFPVFWSCQFAVHASNVSLQQWKGMGGVEIDQGDIIVKAIHAALNAPSAILKVCYEF